VHDDTHIISLQHKLAQLVRSLQKRKGRAKQDSNCSKNNIWILWFCFKYCH